MPRAKSHTAQSLTDDALMAFWSLGYGTTSMDDLVKATGVSRHGIYSDFGGKRELFLACFDRYRDLVVNPAFAAVEQPGAKLVQIARYFEHQIAAAEKAGLPGPGCFVANSATEVAPHDQAVLNKVMQHNDRLQNGFATAIRNSLPPETSLKDTDVDDLAASVVVFATGLWSLSRLVSTADRLRSAVRTFMSSMERMLK